MRFDEYSKKAWRTAHYPASATIRGLTYTVLSAAGETGEMCNVVKKVLRRDGQQPSRLEKIQLEEEIGDVLWYLAACARELGTTLDSIAIKNLQKLEERYNPPSS